MKDSTEFLLESYPYSISNLFALHDISKEEYSYLLPQVSGRKRYTFMRNYEGAEWSNTGHPLTIKSRDMLVVFPEHPEISFYTKLLLSENLQTIRTFFLSEVFTFFIAILGFNLYELFQYHYRRKHGVSYSISKRSHLKLSGIYASLSMVIIVIIVIICISPTRIITVSNYRETVEPSLFKPYDISLTYYKMAIEPDNLLNDTIVWSSNEIVEFSSMQQPHGVLSSKSLSFTHFDKNTSFKNEFYTKNLVSKNLQDIRLFLLTTFLLLFIARWFVHLRHFLVHGSKRNTKVSLLRRI